jgi:F-type H+-transporting ATPase subunit alpha
MKEVAGRLKLDLAQFRAMEAFAMFASDLDPASRAQLAKGARLVELLKQKQAAPFPVEEQVVSIWAGTTGQLDDVAVEDISRFETEFLDYLRREKSGLLSAIRESKKFEDETRSGLEDAVKAFKDQFQGSGKEALPLGHEPDAGELETEIEQEKIVKQKR